MQVARHSPIGVLQNLHELSALEQAGAGEWQRALTAEQLSSTWLATEGLEKIVNAARGTKPGDPLADIIFNFVLSRVLARVDGRLAQEELVEYMDWNGCNSICPRAGDDSPVRVRITEISFMDDVAAMLLADSPESILIKLARATAVITDTFTEFGLVLNFLQGKTEALVKLVGVSAKRIKRKL
jgi:hypothetical protein